MGCTPLELRLARLGNSHVNGSLEVSRDRSRSSRSEALPKVESSRLMGELPESELVPASPDRAEEPTELAPAEPAEPTSSPMVEPEIEREDSRERDSEGELAGFEEMSLVGGDPWLSLTADEGSNGSLLGGYEFQFRALG
ncbi:unnamed protein product [Effrenium voratum]|nr:unnamed protein product [Effrenium voratum]